MTIVSTTKECTRNFIFFFSQILSFVVNKISREIKIFLRLIKLINSHIQHTHIHTYIYFQQKYKNENIKFMRRTKKFKNKKDRNVNQTTEQFKKKNHNWHFILSMLIKNVHQTTLNEVAEMNKISCLKKEEDRNKWKKCI